MKLTFEEVKTIVPVLNVALEGNFIYSISDEGDFIILPENWFVELIEQFDNRMKAIEEELERLENKIDNNFNMSRSAIDEIERTISILKVFG